MSKYNTLANVTINGNLSGWHFMVKIIRIYSYKLPVERPLVPPSTVWTYILADKAGSKIEMIMFPPDAQRFKGLEDHEGDWVEILNVQLMRAVTTPFRFGNSRCILVVFEATRINPIEALKDHHYMKFKCIHEMKYITMTDIPIDIMGVVFNDEPLDVCWADQRKKKLVFYIRDNVKFQIKCVATGDSAYAFENGFAKMRGRGVVIVVMKMWRICNYVLEDPWLETYEGISDFRFNPWMEDVEYFRQSLANSGPYVVRHGTIVFNYM